MASTTATTVAKAAFVFLMFPPKLKLASEPLLPRFIVSLNYDVEYMNKYIFSLKFIVAACHVV
jgi:hypothetical protein